jgi:hypothetical protein
LTFEHDSEGVIRRGAKPAEGTAIKMKAAKIWATASHCHFNRDFQFNSQSTAMQFTERLTIGGRAWPSIKLNSPEQEKALTAWANTSLGLLLHWWHANKQQSGRGSIGVTALQALPVLDVAALSKKQLQAAVRIFDDFKARPMRPINEMMLDPVRQELDERFGKEVLGMPAGIAAADGPLGLLRAKLAAEPSAAGTKKSSVSVPLTESERQSILAMPSVQKDLELFLFAQRVNALPRPQKSPPQQQPPAKS